MDKDTWRDKQFDYFRTSDGKVVRVRRDKVREAEEAADARLRRRVMLWNQSTRFVLLVFVTASSLWLAVLIALELIGGAG